MKTVEEIEKLAIDSLKEKWGHLYINDETPKKPYPTNFQNDIDMFVLGYYKSIHTQFQVKAEGVSDEEIDKMFPTEKFHDYKVIANENKRIGAKRMRDHMLPLLDEKDERINYLQSLCDLEQGRHIETKSELEAVKKEVILNKDNGQYLFIRETAEYKELQSELEAVKRDKREWIDDHDDIKFKYEKLKSQAEKLTLENEELKMKGAYWENLYKLTVPTDIKK